MKLPENLFLRFLYNFPKLAKIKNTDISDLQFLYYKKLRTLMWKC